MKCDVHLRILWPASTTCFIYHEYSSHLLDLFLFQTVDLPRSLLGMLEYDYEFIYRLTVRDIANPI
jgi:hypothetical protein